jgi:hypothetical protein
MGAKCKMQSKNATPSVQMQHQQKLDNNPNYLNSLRPRLRPGINNSPRPLFHLLPQKPASTLQAKLSHSPLPLGSSSDNLFLSITHVWRISTLGRIAQRRVQIALIFVIHYRAFLSSAS